MQEQKIPLSIFLNRVTPLKIQVIPEDFLVETLHALFFHLSTSGYIFFDKGTFKLNPMIGTPDYTPKSIQSMTKSILEAASNLYAIKSFVKRESISSLQSVLQESIQNYILSPFYNEINAIKSDSILDFAFQLRPIYNKLRNVYNLVMSPRPAEYAFSLARHGVKDMLHISISCLQLFEELCKDVITVHRSNALNSPGFFIKSEEDPTNQASIIYVDELPSAVPQEFAEDISKAALALVIRAPPVTFDKPISHSIISSYNDTSSDHFITFDLLLPAEIPQAETPEEEITNFRLAAWSLSKSKSQAAPKKATPEYSNLENAVKSILLEPLWDKAKVIQQDLVKFIIEDQKIIEVVEDLTDLFLLRRGDLHNLYISNAISRESSGSIFAKHLTSIPFFTFRFTSNSIMVSLPPRIRRVISSSQLIKYRNYYQWGLKIKTLYYKVALVSLNRIYAALRMKLLHFLMTLYQITYYQITDALFQFKQDITKAETLDNLIDIHEKFVSVISIASLERFPEISRQFANILNFADEFCRLANDISEKCTIIDNKILQQEMTKEQKHKEIIKMEREVQNIEETYESIISIILGILLGCVKVDPFGLAATLLQAIPNPNKFR